MTRRALRENIFKILFKAEFNSIEEMNEQLGYSLADIPEMEASDEEYITSKVDSILANVEAIDAIIEEIAEGWKIERIGKAELAILRLAIYEIKYDEDIPYKVSVNEAVELSKRYCNLDAGSFINGILAKVKD